MLLVKDEPLFYFPSFDTPNNTLICVGLSWTSSMIPATSSLSANCAYWPSFTCSRFLVFLSASWLGFRMNSFPLLKFQVYSGELFPCRRSLLWQTQEVQIFADRIQWNRLPCHPSYVSIRLKSNPISGLARFREASESRLLTTYYNVFYYTIIERRGPTSLRWCYFTIQ